MHHSERPDTVMTEKIKELVGASVSISVDDMKRKLDEEICRMELGATGQFPGGKLTTTDEGEIKIAIGVVDGKVVINFGKPVAWIGFDSKQARQLAESLRQKSYQAKG